MSNNPFANVQTVFIDLDDTLWWFTENSKVAFRLTYDQFHIADFCGYDRFHEVYLAKNLELWHLYHYGKITRSLLMTERFRHTLEQCGYDGDCLEMSKKMNEAYLDTLGTLKQLVPGALDLVEHLHKQGFEVNVLSNGFRGTQEAKLRSAGLLPLIDRIVLSDDCGITKPLRGIFDYALGQCHATAENTVMIGDDPDADIAGAHNAGWLTIYYNWRNTDAAPGTATATVTSLTDITNLILSKPACESRLI